MEGTIHRSYSAIDCSNIMAHKNCLCDHPRCGHAVMMTGDGLAFSLDVTSLSLSLSLSVCQELGEMDDELTRLCMLRCSARLCVLNTEDTAVWASWPLVETSELQSHHVSHLEFSFLSSLI